MRFRITRVGTMWKLDLVTTGPEPKLLAAFGEFDTWAAAYEYGGSL